MLTTSRFYDHLRDFWHFWHDLGASWHGYMTCKDLHPDWRRYILRTLRFLGLSWVLAFNVSCVGEYADDEEMLLSSGAETVSNKRTQAACNQRWTGLSSVPSARRVDYSGARSQCAGGPQSGAIKLGNFIRDNFAAYMDLSVPGNGVQIYNCRSVRGGRSRSVHGDGRAVDIFIPTLPGGVADNDKGDRIANWLAENSAEIGIQYIIWDRGSFMGERSPQSKCYTGSHPTTTIFTWN